MQTTMIVCFWWNEARHFALKNALPRGTWKFVRGPEDLRGISEKEIVVILTDTETKYNEYDQIIEAVNKAVVIHKTKVIRISKDALLSEVTNDSQSSVS
jgi:hypothetical protein